MEQLKTVLFRGWQTLKEETSITGFNEWNNSTKKKGRNTMKNNELILILEHDLRVPSNEQRNREKMSCYE